MCRAIAMSFSPFQNASSRLTLVLWPAITIERLTTGDFIPISRFDPVLIEVVLGFVAPGPHQVSFRPGNSVREARRRGLFPGLEPFSPFSLSAEVDDGAHSELGGIGILWRLTVRGWCIRKHRAGAVMTITASRVNNRR